MPRFFFHIRRDEADILDPEKRDLVDLEAAKAVALAAVLDMLSQDMKTGRIDLRLSLEVEDDRRAVVYHLPFSSAFETTP